MIGGQEEKKPVHYFFCNFCNKVVICYDKSVFRMRCVHCGRPELLSNAQLTPELAIRAHHMEVGMCPHCLQFKRFKVANLHHRGQCNLCGKDVKTIEVYRLLLYRKWLEKPEEINYLLKLRMNKYSYKTIRAFEKRKAQVEAATSTTESKV
jgi:hypothetical protein